MRVQVPPSPSSYCWDGLEGLDAELLTRRSLFDSVSQRMIITKERYEKAESKLHSVSSKAEKKIQKAEPSDRLKLELDGMTVVDVEVYSSPAEVPIFVKESDEFEDVEFTPSDDNPIKCRHCGQRFSEHFKTVIQCHDTTTKLMTKKKYKRLEEAKYDTPCRDAKKVIDEASEDSLLKLKIKLDGGLQVLEAFEIEDREDMIQAMTKNPE